MIGWPVQRVTMDHGYGLETDNGKPEARNGKQKRKLNPPTAYRI